MTSKEKTKVREREKKVVTKRVSETEEDDNLHGGRKRQRRKDFL